MNQLQADDNLQIVKGAIPGANDDCVVIRESKEKRNRHR